MNQTRMCAYCPHNLGNQLLIMVEDEDGPLHAGYIECPEVQCACVCTFSSKTPDGTLIGGERAERFLAGVRPLMDSMRRRKATPQN
jgi:hypothetical protein